MEGRKEERQKGRNWIQYHDINNNMEKKMDKRKNENERK